MKRLTKFTLLTLLAALVVSCCPCRSYQKRTRRPLVGTEWQLIQLGGRTIRSAEGSFTVTFLAEGNRLAGIGACNRLSATYSADESRALHIGPVAATRMACPEGSDEEAFVEALEATTHYDMDGPLLLLLADGELRAVLQALPAAPAQ